MADLIRVLHVVPALDNSYGGPAYSVPALARAMAPAGVVSCFVSTAAAGIPSHNAEMAEFGDVWHEALRPSRRAAGYYASASRGLIQNILTREHTDIVHLHSLWNHLSATAFHTARALGRPLVLSPRSELLQKSLQRSALKKRVARLLYADKLLGYAAGFHATDATEARDLAEVARGRPTAIIGNGIDTSLGAELPAREVALKTLGLPKTRRYVLFLGRLHERKGPSLVLDAAARAGIAAQGWGLIFAGDGQGASGKDALQRQANALGLGEHAHFLGHVEAERKACALAAGSLFVLPTEFENFGNSIAEALSCGLPVLTTPYTPWTEVLTTGAGWVVERMADELADALREAIALPDEVLRARAATAESFMAARSWASVGAKMAEFYRTLLHPEAAQT
jgi:glycosyltransferase involved in cell wall biosynthesis